jgi:hypothetical protein
MKIKNNLIIKNRQENSMAKALRTHCLFSFFLFFFIWIQPTVYAGYQSDKKSGKNKSGYQVKQDSKKHSTSKIPSNSFPVPSDQESSDENQVTEDFWDSMLPAGDPLDYQYDFSLFKSLNIRIGQLSQSYRNSPGVALFILHHSWKSYLH